ncbi:DUF7832 domain-containing protein [Phenylobacterium sp.]|uniref:DUF7832 domain-containing protein n=1 Tax=Phenylobacterium sp. TaxID=1871053 RepID=UPI00300146A5
MKYDDASWHYGGDFPAHLPREAAATHIAMFVAWCALNGMAGELHTSDSAELLASLKARDITPTQWFIAACDEKFTDEDLTEEGNAFAAAYYGAGGNLASAPNAYLSDYEKGFPEAVSLYEVSDTWQSFDRIAPKIARRLKRRSKPRWLKRWF